MMAVQSASQISSPSKLSLAVLIGFCFVTPQSQAEMELFPSQSVFVSSQSVNPLFNDFNLVTPVQSTTEMPVIDAAIRGGADSTEVYVLSTLVEQAQVTGNTELMNLLSSAATDEEAARLARALTPDRSGANIYAVLQSQEVFANAIKKRTRDNIHGIPAQSNFWLSLLGNDQTSYVNSDGSNRYDGFNSSSYGAAFGFDKIFSGNSLLGLAFSHQHIETGSRLTANSSEIETLQAAVYGETMWHDINFSGRGIVGRGSHKISRNIEGGSDFSGHTNADGRTQSTTASLQVDMSYPIYVSSFTFLPVVSSSYNYAMLDGYSEDYVRTYNNNGVLTKSTGSAAALSYDTQFYDELLFGAGLEIAHTWFTGIGALHSRLGGHVNYNALDTDLNITSRLVSGGDSFTVQANSREKLRYQSYFDMVLETDGRFSWSLGVQYDWDDSSKNAMAYGRAIYSF
ncbi:autotransporter outer membrane beta-barrel domain-containing protein [Vibrio hangzhouensis]|uniref:Autotransporter beta-domain-containing protein n=1 Tax=Vibrio hangzhouensis TaxID=462991 RepID=A0A1H6B8A7_9VIBR|nr:autotransporter outer membrane beta-barrel domain-containing protein [Vibrio hangzhouensis]SEG56862.1 Autotransporter beta-domain-containing protein [Vibrio hangzhouensis]